MAFWRAFWDAFKLEERLRVLDERDDDHVPPGLHRTHLEDLYRRGCSPWAVWRTQPSPGGAPIIPIDVPSIEPDRSTRNVTSHGVVS